MSAARAVASPCRRECHDLRRAVVACRRRCVPDRGAPLPGRPAGRAGRNRVLGDRLRCRRLLGRGIGVREYWDDGVGPIAGQQTEQHVPDAHLRCGRTAVLVASCSYPRQVGEGNLLVRAPGATGVNVTPETPQY